MVASDRPGDVELVACETCMKEVPVSEAAIPEVTHYLGAIGCRLD